MKFSVIGGDMRTARLSGLLLADGHEVRTFALDQAPNAAVCGACGTVKDALRGAECVVLPLPVTGEEGQLTAPLSSREHTVESVLNEIEPGSLVCGGMAMPETRELGMRLGIYIVDYFRREELVVKNAVATAEGVIGIIMRETPVTIWNMKVLVVGYGHLGKVVSQRLHALGADVSVSSRSCGDRAWCEAFGYKALNTTALEGHIGDFDVVVNTVPAMVLGEGRLRELKEGVLCIDLASKPGGMDFAAASRLGINNKWALSLPGKVAPVSAGAIIRDTIYNIINEKQRINEISEREKE